MRTKIDHMENHVDTYLNIAKRQADNIVRLRSRQAKRRQVSLLLRTLLVALGRKRHG